jgi:hypothetical protein
MVVEWYKFGTATGQKCPMNYSSELQRYTYVIIIVTNCASTVKAPNWGQYVGLSSLVAYFELALLHSNITN